jgi:methylated-DNA-[protein]-cysteine S-methyltransferase
MRIMATMPAKPMPRSPHPEPTGFVQTWISPLGNMLLAAHDAGLMGVWFEGQKHYPALLQSSESAAIQEPHPVLRETQAQLQAYFNGRLSRFDLPLDQRRGTPFQQSVWQALINIPSGKTISYARLSQQIGRPTAVRAIAAAVGRNPLSIVVPCHRVVGSNGSLTGYAGGLERKAALLQLEQHTN